MKDTELQAHKSHCCGSNLCRPVVTVHRRCKRSGSGRLSLRRAVAALAWPPIRVLRAAGQPHLRLKGLCSASAPSECDSDPRANAAPGFRGQSCRHRDQLPVSGRCAAPEHRPLEAPARPASRSDGFWAGPHGPVQVERVDTATCGPAPARSR